MPAIFVPIFAFAGCYVGTYGATGVMTAVTDLRTNGAKLKEDFPTNYVRVLDNHIQSDNHTFDVTLAFLSDSTLVGALALGRSITASTQYTPPGNQQYNLLLIDAQGIDSYFFPKLSTLKTRATEYQKDKAVTTEITFRAENRDPNVILAYQASVATLQGIMGSISPV